MLQIAGTARSTGLRRSRPDQALPSPANSRNPARTTATAYSGWLRKRMNRWMNAISTNRNASPSRKK